LLAIVTVAVYASADALRTSQRNRLSDRVSATAEMLQRSISVARHDLAILAEISRLSVDPESLHTKLDNLQIIADQLTTVMQNKKDYTQALIFLENEGIPRFIRGNRVGNRVQVLIDAPMSISSIDSLLKEKQGARSINGNLTEISSWLPNTSEIKRRILYFSDPIVSKRGEIMGGAALIIDAAALLADTEIPPGDSILALTDATGAFLYRSDRPIGWRPGALDASARNEFRLGQRWTEWMNVGSSTMLFDMPQQRRVIGLHKVLLTDRVVDPDTDLLVVGGLTSLDEVEMNVSSLRLRLTVIVFLMGALMIGALIWSTRHITQPMGAITDAADRIAAGEKNVSIPTGRSDDIGTLARSIQRMANSLQEKGKMEEAAAMGRMAVTIAHDLRNALTSVKMNMHILSDHLNKLGSNHHDNCAIAIEQIDYMEEVLEDILTFARPELRHAADWFDLNDAMLTAEIAVSPRLDAKSIDFGSERKWRIPKIFGDRTRIIRVIQNLLHNAVEACEPHGRIAMTAKTTLIEGRQAVEIRITDNGQGLTDEIANRAFEAFFTTRQKGTGLGLAIVAQIVGAHRGQVHLEAGPTGGCVATVTLPIEPLAPDSGSSEAAQTSASNALS
jgi:signal transduction histidine kinase